MTVTETAPADAPAPPPPVEPSIAKLSAALAAFQSELPQIRKDQTAQVRSDKGNYSYTYADLATVSLQVMPLLGKHGLSFTSWPSTTPRGFMLRYYLLHESGEQMAGEYPLPVDVKSPQAMGSAITYARRYALCSVTGVSPDDDDDAAAAEGAKASRRAEQQEEVSKELADARDKVRGAWAVQFGAFDGDQAAELFRTWAQGKGTLGGATAGQLSNFAGYIHTLPLADAGSDPNQATLLPPADDGTRRRTPGPAGPGKKMTKLQQGRIFALFSDLGMTGAPDQRSFLSTALERQIKSRSELTVDDANIVIPILEEAAQNVSGPAAGAQSASGETSVPAGPETPPEDGGQ